MRVLAKSIGEDHGNARIGILRPLYELIPAHVFADRGWDALMSSMPRYA